MRLALFLLPPLFLVAPFAACSSSPSSSSPVDAGADRSVSTGVDAADALAFDVPVMGEAAPVTNCKLYGDADPVGLCVQKGALTALHEHAFAATKGVAASWSSTTGAPDPGDAGVVPYSLDDTVAYAAAAAEYLASAEVYGDTTINGLLGQDLQAIALQLESSFTAPATSYSGELYFHLRSVAVGLRFLGLTSDGAKFDLLADSYGRSIFASHYVPLGSLAAPPVDAGGGEAGRSADAGHDGSAEAGRGLDASAQADGGAPGPDGIFGNRAGAAGQVAYSPGDVATAAYALLDMVGRHPSDPSVPSWLRAVRAALRHLRLRAVEPTTGMLYRALLASPDGDGGASASGGDPLAPSTDPTLPADALLADTQATFALAMVRAQYLVTTGTTANLGGIDASGPIVDAGVSGPFLPVLDLPLEAWADTAIKAMNGAHSLWDGKPAGTGAGYMDGYVPSLGALITTKSTRPNALMAAALARAYVNSDLVLQGQLPSLVQLLVAQRSLTVALHSSLMTVIDPQQAYLVGATKGFTPLDAGPHPTSYASSAVSVAVEGLNEQLVGRQ